MRQHHVLLFGVSAARVVKCSATGRIRQKRKRMANNPIAPVINTDDLPALTAAELKSGREYLGLSTAWMAEHLVIAERRIQRMESGQESIPTTVVNLMDDAHADAKQLFEDLSSVYRRKVKAAAGQPAFLPTYRTDKSADEAGTKYPSRFYRHIAARVSVSAPGAIIVYSDQIPAEDETAPDNL